MKFVEYDENGDGRIVDDDWIIKIGDTEYKVLDIVDTQCVSERSYKNGDSDNQES